MTWIRDDGWWDEPSWYWDREGNQLSMRQWAVLREDRDYLVVAFTSVSEDVDVSTAWVGLALGMSIGPPLIFETMVFGGPLDLEQERYPTEVAALAGHDQMVAAVRECMAKGTRP